jgi:integrase
MARKIRDAKLESRSARLRLPVRKKPYTGPTLARGIHLPYRRNKDNGTWIVKCANAHGGYWTKGFAQADDFEEADGTHVLDFYQACDAAKALARGRADTPDSKPMTVADAIAAYKRDLTSRGGHLGNATRVEKHLTSPVAGKPVALLSVRDLQTWRNGLIEKGLEPSSVNRTRTGLRAALELAATLDHRISNRHVFRLGLRGLPAANRARRIVLPDANVLCIVKAAYEIDPAFGLMVDVLAVTGARLSQAARLTCSDLQADRPDPRLMMPSSFKGRGHKKFSYRPVPITLTLAAALKKAKADRPDHAPLLVKQNGTAWQATSTVDHRDLFRHAIKQAQLKPEITSYALRHSSIVRALLGGVPLAVVAQQHDTSVREIETHYAAYILDHSDALSRRALLDTARPIASNLLESSDQPPAAAPEMHSSTP